MIELNKIYVENCLDTMGKMDDDFIDLVITSPPYDNIRDYKGYSFDFENIAKELYRVVKPGGVIVWVVGDAIENKSETLTSFKQALYFKEQCGFNIHDTMIYKKSGMRFPERTRYYQNFEYMFVISKGTPKTIHLISDRENKWAGYTNFSQNSVRKTDGSLVEIKDCKRYKKYGVKINIWEYNNGYGYGTKDKIAYTHPATFPEQLVEDHIISWTNEEDLVYDCFMGSGTTAKISILTNRKYVGSEISEEYVKIANQRISELEAQRGSRLFILKQKEIVRLIEEDEHRQKIEQAEKLMDSKKKWQPNIPIKQSKPQDVILPAAEEIRNAILSVETE